MIGDSARVPNKHSSTYLLILLFFYYSVLGTLLIIIIWSARVKVKCKIYNLSGQNRQKDGLKEYVFVNSVVVNSDVVKNTLLKTAILSTGIVLSRTIIRLKL